MAQRGYATALTDGPWLHLSPLLPPPGLGHPLRSGQGARVASPSHLCSLPDKDPSLQCTLTSLKVVVQALNMTSSQFRLVSTPRRHSCRHLRIRL